MIDRGRPDDERSRSRAGGARGARRHAIGSRPGRPPVRSRRGLAAFVVTLAVAGATIVAFPAPAVADESPCASLYPTIGPGGVDLQAACAAGRVATHYTSSGGAASDIPSTLLIVLAVSWALAVVAFAAARILATRAARRSAPVPPSSVWLCDACHSFNDGESSVCYRCRRARPEDAPSVTTGEPPAIEQRFGRPFGS